MKNRLLTASLIVVAAALSGCLSGCQIRGFKADEIHRTISFPGFSDELHAVGIQKVPGEDGSVKRKAETLTHTTSVFGVSRSATYKGAEIETESK